LKSIRILYDFQFEDGKEARINLEIDSKTLQLVSSDKPTGPEWAKLDFHKCPNCTLKKETTTYCPLAINIEELITKFDGYLSYDKILLRVVTKNRNYSKRTSLQQGISSLLGLIFASCGCPQTLFFTPMAYFHTPLSSVKETVFRAVSSYMIAQHLLKKEGHAYDEDLKGLEKIYQEMQIVNLAVADRLRAATTSDSTVNAVILLDTYAKALPLVIDTALSELQDIFYPYISHHIKTGLITKSLDDASISD
jgi:hypothetical protein